MAELATIARPYAEALFEVARKGDMNQWVAQVDELAAVAADERMRQFADNPNVGKAQVFDLITSVVRTPLSEAAKNFLRTLIDNDRLAALPEIAAQFHALKNASTGTAAATIYSAYPIDAAQQAALVATLERRFGRRLEASVEIDPALIGGVRVVVGDEVLDTSVKARLDRMRVALTS